MSEEFDFESIKNEIKEFMDHRSPESLMELFEKEDKKKKPQKERLDVNEGIDTLDEVGGVDLYIDETLMRLSGGP